MEFGLNFFPCVDPAERSAEQYYSDVLHLTSLCDELGYSHVRQVEHYFHPYGGYSPNPMLFLAAAAKVTKRARMVTGAVLPVFNNPLKLAGEIAMLDAISGGRLDVGFARAFLPHEFEKFGISLEESRERFTEGLAQVRLLLESDNASSQGKFHSFSNVTSLPRPTQKPRPPIWVATLSTPQSFKEAGERGDNLMVIPIEASKMVELIGSYREAWRSAGHPGQGKVISSFFMCCAPTREEAMDTARGPIGGHQRGLLDSASGWLSGSSTKDYPGYDKVFAKMREETFENMVAKGMAWVGTIDDIVGFAREYHRKSGGFDIASLLTTPSNMPLAAAERSIRLFAKEAMPQLKGL